MSVQSSIQEKIAALNPIHLEVINESFMHNVPDGSESHFKIVLVTDHFEGKMLIARHRMVNEILAAEIAGPIHALSLHTMTPDEWTKKGGRVTDSPDCLGGSKK